MYYEQLFQTTEAKMNFVKGLIHISKADGVISPEEQTFFIDVMHSISPPTNFCIASRVLSSSISFGSSIGRSARTLIFSSFIVCLQIKTGQSTRTVLQKVKGSVRRHSPVDNYFFLTIQRFLKNAMP